MEATITKPPSTPINGRRRPSPHQFPPKSCRTTFPRKTPTPSISATTASATTVIHVRNPMSLYNVLRVRRDATLEDIKKAYRKLAKLYHPDSSSDCADSKEFMAIRDAYATLSDPTARALYDLSIGLGYCSAQMIGDFVGISGYRRGRRWETDQCW